MLPKATVQNEWEKYFNFYFITEDANQTTFSFSLLYMILWCIILNWTAQSTLQASLLLPHDAYVLLSCLYKR